MRLRLSDLPRKTNAWVAALSAAFWCTAALIPACNNPDPSAPIADVWRDRCAKCHGDSGRGDGDAAERLDPKPRDLSDPLWQSARTDKMIADTIVLGGAAIGRSSLMPPHADLAPRRAELVEWVRALQGATIRPASGR